MVTYHELWEVDCGRALTRTLRVTADRRIASLVSGADPLDVLSRPRHVCIIYPAPSPLAIVSSTLAVPSRAHLLSLAILALAVFSSLAPVSRLLSQASAILRHPRRTYAIMPSNAPELPLTREQWTQALDALPATPDRIPAFFFGHGSPVLAWPEADLASAKSGPMDPYLAHGGPHGPLAAFLRDFGPALLAKYNPKAILVFSAHWDTAGETLVSDYGDENPLFMDYYGFKPAMYDVTFKSRGNAALAHRVVDLLKQAGINARTTPPTEPRGRDGRGRTVAGLDHGVFVPFRFMFGDDALAIPIVAASIDGSLAPERNWALGSAVAKLREEGVLVLSGGLTVHNLGDLGSLAPASARPLHHAFNDAVTAAITLQDPAERKAAMVDLVRHEGCRASHPREDHFVPVYVAAGAGADGGVRLLAGTYGCQTVAFGL